MRTLFIVIVTFFYSLTVFGTAQIPDKIIYHGKEYDLIYNPMEIYFKKNPFKIPEDACISTSLWRRYIATFEVKNNQLYLKDINILVDDTTDHENRIKLKSIMNDVFPNQDIIKIDWLTGFLVLPYGEIVDYVHAGYDSTYENYLLLQFENGRFKKQKKFKYKEYEVFKEKQFEVFKKTEEYQKMKDDWNGNDSSLDGYIKRYHTEKYTSIVLNRRNNFSKTT